MLQNKQLISASKFLITGTEVSPYSFIENLLMCGITSNDRFDIFTKYSLLNWKPCNEYENFINFNYNDFDFDQFIHNQVEFFINKAISENKKIILSWSGGVDSTFLCVLFLTQNQKRVPIEVLASYESVKESPEILKFITEKTNTPVTLINSLHLHNYLNNRTDYLIITGHISDQVFGFGRIQVYCPFFNDYYIDAFYKWAEHRKLNMLLDNWSFYKDSIDIIEEEINIINKQRSDFNIKTWAQFSSYIINTCKTTCMRYIDQLNSNSLYYKNNLYPFFNSIDLLNWGLIKTNNDLLKYNYNLDSRNYKTLLKDYIVKITKLPNFYFKNKTISEIYAPRCGRFEILDTDGYHFISDNMDSLEKYKYLINNYRRGGKLL